MTVEPDFGSFVPAPTPAAPAAGPSFTPADLLLALGDQDPPFVKAVTRPDIALVGAQGGRAKVAGLAAEQAVAGLAGLIRRSTSPKQSKGFDTPLQKRTPSGGGEDLVGAPDSLTAAELLARFNVKQNLMGQARLAATIEQHRTRLARSGSIEPAGAGAAAQLDFAKVKHLFETGGISDTDAGKELKRLWAQWSIAPEALSDGEVTGLLDLVSQIGDSTEAFESTDLSFEGGKVDKVDLLPDGPAPRVALVPERAAGVLKQVSKRLPELSEGDGLAVHLLPGGTEVAVSAPVSAEVGRKLRNLYPAIGKMWAPARPRVVPFLDDVARRFEDSPGIIAETWSPGAWDQNGGHPALSGDVVITAVVPDGPLPRGLRKLGAVLEPKGAAVQDRPEPPGEPLPEGQESDLATRGSVRVRRVVVQPATYSGIAETAGQIELLGGTDVVVYAPGDAPEGWVNVREHFFSDPTGSLMAVRSGVEEHEAPHGVDAWVRERPEGEFDGASRSPVVVPKRPVAPGLFYFGDVMVSAPGATFEKADITRAVRNGSGGTVAIGLSRLDTVPLLNILFQNESPEGYEAVATVDGDRLTIRSDPNDLSPAVELGLALGQAGVDPKRIRLEGSKYRNLAVG